MPSTSIGNNIEFYYEDSGSVQGHPQYTTLVFVHGIGFHGGVFKKLFPIAKEHGFRIIGIHRRDYSPTTALTEDEVKLLHEGSDGQKEWLRQRGVELAKFLHNFIDKNSIPPTQGENSGGLAVVGWSLGTIMVQAMISNLDSLPQSVLKDLSGHLHTVILQDASVFGLGLPSPPQYSHSPIPPSQDPKKFPLFQYYRHTDISSGRASTIQFEDPESSVRNPTFYDTSSEEMEQIKPPDRPMFTGSDVIVLKINREIVMKDTMRRAFFSKELAINLPHLRVRYFAAGEAAGIFTWTVWELEKALVNPDFYGERAVRDVKVVPCKIGNHFIFWDQPEEALRIYRCCIET